MWLWRRLHDEDSGFPDPIRITGRRFWRLRDLVGWERRLASGAQPSPEEGQGQRQGGEALVHKHAFTMAIGGGAVDTLASRSIFIHMKRRAPDEQAVPIGNGSPP